MKNSAAKFRFPSDILGRVGASGAEISFADMRYSCKIEAFIIVMYIDN